MIRRKFLTIAAAVPFAENLAKAETPARPLGSTAPTPVTLSVGPSPTFLGNSVWLRIKHDGLLTVQFYGKAGELVDTATLENNSGLAEPVTFMIQTEKPFAQFAICKERGPFSCHGISIGWERPFFGPSIHELNKAALAHEIAG